MRTIGGDCPLLAFAFNQELDLICSYHDDLIRVWNYGREEGKVVGGFKCGVMNPQEMVFFTRKEEEEGRRREEEGRKKEEEGRRREEEGAKENYLVIGDLDGSIYFFVQEGEGKNFINKKIGRNHRGAVNRLILLPPSSLLSSSLEDNYIYLWDLRTFSILHVLPLYEFKRIRGLFYYSPPPSTLPPTNSNSSPPSFFPPSTDYSSPLLLATGGSNEILVVDLDRKEVVGGVKRDGWEFMEVIGGKEGIAVFGKNTKKNEYCVKMILDKLS